MSPAELSTTTANTSGEWQLRWPPWHSDSSCISEAILATVSSEWYPPPMGEQERDSIEKLVCGRWKRRAEAIEICKSGEWSRFRSSVTEPGLLSFAGKSAYRSCRDHATGIFSGPVEKQIEIIPLWVGGLHDVEEPVDAWFSVHGLKSAGEALDIVELGDYFDDADPCVNVRFRCQVHEWVVGVLVESKSYSPEIELQLRRGRYAVTKATITELLSYGSVDSDRALPRPTQKAPPYASWFEPRVAGLSDELVEEIRALSITVDEEGELIDRPSESFVLATKP